MEQSTIISRLESFFSGCFTGGTLFSFKCTSCDAFLYCSFGCGKNSVSLCLVSDVVVCKSRISDMAQTNTRGRLVQCIKSLKKKGSPNCGGIVFVGYFIIVVILQLKSIGFYILEFNLVAMKHCSHIVIISSILPFHRELYLLPSQLW